MSTRTRLAPVQVMNASMSGTVNSTATLLQSLSSACYQISWTGSSPTGSLSLQGSEDYALGPTGQISVAGTWTNMTFTYNGSNVSSIAISGSSGNGLIDITKTALNAIRLQYVASGGSGTITAIISGKVS